VLKLINLISGWLRSAEPIFSQSRWSDCWFMHRKILPWGCAARYRVGKLFYQIKLGLDGQAAALLHASSDLALQDVHARISMLPVITKSLFVKRPYPLITIIVV
jgi:hypothetical protein